MEALLDGASDGYRFIVCSDLTGLLTLGISRAPRLSASRIGRGAFAEILMLRKATRPLSHCRPIKPESGSTEEGFPRYKSVLVKVVTSFPFSRTLYVWS